jgi:hypothetical protein
MRFKPLILLPIAFAIPLAACEHGNIQRLSDYSAPPPPPMHNPVYDPYAGYGDANATWEPPVFNRDGNIVKPADPSTQADRPDYEGAPWATGAGGRRKYAPPGTF